MKKGKVTAMKALFAAGPIDPGEHQGRVSMLLTWRLETREKQWPTIRNTEKPNYHAMLWKKKAKGSRRLA